MTAQDAYEKVRAYFSRPDAVLGKYTTAELDAHHEEGRTLARCFYRKNCDALSPERCSVGVLIPDELYQPEMDSVGNVNSLLREWPSLWPVFGVKRRSHGDPVYDFLISAQARHDNYSTTSPIQFVDMLDEAAREMGLVVPA